ncbi:hypothetical protein [Rhizobium halophytocola]|uniref:Uncharacterized protein n=1 Tax=Rhizobium halophytocola TaxID=735519 RepID=A0ABS4E665_9HYPH|nr:hypothetical protein [Rhizobium halophytocola]MBP1853440.1 hypothetical protein [Rhizobium halophytocola]
MPDFNVESDRLKMRIANPDDQSKAMTRMGRGPSLDYITYAPGPRDVGARNARGGAAAAGLRMAAEAFNSYSLHHWLEKWLENNQGKILEAMMAKGHRAFVVQFNYSENNFAETRSYFPRNAFLAGTVPTAADSGEVLTAQFMYGPKADAIPPNSSTKFRYAYLVGELK